MIECIYKFLKIPYNVKYCLRHVAPLLKKGTTMKGTAALALAQKVSELIQLCASFQAKYGRYYSQDKGNNAEACELCDEILTRQIEIAALLDVSTLEAQQAAGDEWWKRHDVIDLSIAKTMMQQVSHLIASCAYQEAETGTSERSHAVRSAQASIASLLHPSARMMALSSGSAKSERYAG